MDPFHERLAETGLSAIGRYGFVLAGGYAVQAAGLLDRPSDDVDLFTVWQHRDAFATAVATIRDAYLAAGLKVEVARESDTFARLVVSDDSQSSRVELSIDWRDKDPVQLPIGPVLHPDDAVANKMAALFARAAARDFIDVDAAIESGRYDREALLRLAERGDSGFDRQIFADAVRQAQDLDAEDFAQYGVSGKDLVDLRARFADWYSELRGQSQG